jgi:hypothetical protein
MKTTIAIDLLIISRVLIRMGHKRVLGTEREP